MMPDPSDINESHRQFINAVSTAGPCILISIFGYVIFTIKMQNLSIAAFLAGLLTSAFASFLASIIMSEMNMSFGWTTVICGVIGYTGGKGMDYIVEGAMGRMERIFGAPDEHKSSGETPRD